MFGRWDADAFLDEIDEEQFQKWMAFARVEPFGPWAEDQRSAMGLALHANVHRDHEKKKEPFTAADFMLSKVNKPTPARLPLKVQRERMEAYLGTPTRQWQTSAT